ncbi:MAG: DUF1501 domain-containing protein [Methylovulum sp.]|uniref:DUF1501 domain-containing protein n=1 Tax=Methylovulum sp. TaxID=1916980 RepID=UPI0026346A0F|nr:DUF1501 domain-containing protein [Methylovulum sp.]MDD2722540.1 DUF1501 domain-containing protein [Methylovulum sp.]MDD5123068.1 DUF1501 domain-containing protein [Methylovulum sp.]
MNRRLFLQSLAAASGMLAFRSNFWAAPASDARFLLVFLRGGYDAANILIPHSSDFYYQVRPQIAIAKPDPANIHAALPINADWGLHPALKTSVWPLFQQGQAAFIPFAGTDDLSRSHFETQDSIAFGQPLTGPKDYRSGFLNRLAGVLSGRHAVSFTDDLPIICKGEATIPNISLKKHGKPVFAGRQADILSEMYKGRALNTYVQEGMELRAEVAQDLEQEMIQANRGAIPSKGFEDEAQRMAHLMRDKFNIGFVDIGGWDTHLNEGGAEGQLANKIGSLGNGLAAFATAMGPLWQKTTVLVISEFGRTFRENGNRGTDHGHGTVYWVLGGGIKGKRVVGEQLRVEQKNLFQDRDYQVLNEYRNIMGGLFQAQFGLSAKQVQTVFPNTKPVQLGLL